MLKRSSGKVHQFGGDWTQKKLDIVAKYLAAYTTALKKQSFVTAYVDAFAGTGYRANSAAEETHGEESLFFFDIAQPEAQQLLDGSARIALNTEPRFSKYIFIDRDPEHCAELEKLKADFPDKAADITVIEGDANAAIVKLCDETDWRSFRAVMFIDPYGMQLEWATIDKIAATEAIDLWLLFPLGVGVNRLLTKSGVIPPGWRHRLDVLLGTTEWSKELYRVEKSLDLFGTEADHTVKASLEVIGRYFNDRLKTIFVGVAEEPAVLRNSKGSPLYLLCFAAGNEKGAAIALKIAEHILRKAG